MLSQSRSAVLVASLVLLFPHARPAYAQTTPADEARVNALFQEARNDLLAHNYEIACPKLEEVVRMKPGLGARIALGECYLQRGDSVQAIEVYAAVAKEARVLEAAAATQAEREKAKDRADMAEGRVVELGARVGKIKMELPQGQWDLPGFLLRLDQAPLAIDQAGTARWLKPGRHVVEASATGYQKVFREIDLGAGKEETVRLELQPIEQTPPLPLVKPPPPDIPAPSNLPGAQSRSAWVYLASGIGVVALGGVVASALDYRKNRNDAAVHCADSYCDAPGLAERYMTNMQLDIGLMVGLSAVTLGAGFVVYRFAGTKPLKSSSSGTVSAWASGSSGGMQIQGTF